MHRTFFSRATRTITTLRTQNPHHSSTECTYLKGPRGVHSHKAQQLEPHRSTVRFRRGHLKRPSIHIGTTPDTICQSVGGVLGKGPSSPLRTKRTIHIYIYIYTYIYIHIYKYQTFHTDQDEDQKLALCCNVLQCAVMRYNVTIFHIDSSMRSRVCARSPVQRARGRFATISCVC